MKNTYQISIIFLSAFFFQLGLSQIPETLSYQGALSDADGIMVEVHPNPAVAKSDGAQSLTFENFAQLMTQVPAIRESLKGVATTAT